MVPGSANLVAEGWFYVTICDVVTVNFTYCVEIGICIYFHFYIIPTVDSAPFEHKSSSCFIVQSGQIESPTKLISPKQTTIYEVSDKLTPLTV